MTVTFSAAVRDKHIAPGASTFTIAEIPDMSSYTKESPFWVGNFFLNSVLRASFAAPMNAFAYNYLRRAQFAFSEHDLARKSTLAFIEGGSQSVSRYVDALFHWECFLGQAWHAYALLVTAWDGRAFDKGDGSIEQRLNAMYNQMKHVESRIESGQILSDASVPVWLNNQGLCSIDTNLSFVETSDVLKDLAKYANALMDPMTANDTLNEPDA